MAYHAARMEHGMTAIGLKSVGASGQISIGKKYAGRFFELSAQSDGVIILRPMRVVPETEARLHQEPMKGKLKEAGVWLVETPARQTDVKKLLGRKKSA